MGTEKTTTDANNTLGELLALNTKAREVIGANFKDTLGNFDVMSGNFHEIDARNQSNADCLVIISKQFQEKLTTFKEESNVTNKEAIVLTFNTLDVIIKGDENAHKKMIETYEVFKKYYNSKLYLNSANFSFKAIKTALKLLPYVPYKVINEVFSSYTLDTSAADTLVSFVGNVADINKATNISNVGMEKITHYTNGYISFNESKFVINKSNFDGVTTSNVVTAIAKELFKADVMGVSPKLTNAKLGF